MSASQRLALLKALQLHIRHLRLGQKPGDVFMPSCNGRKHMHRKHVQPSPYRTESLIVSGVFSGNCGSSRLYSPSAQTPKDQTRSQFPQQRSSLVASIDQYPKLIWFFTSAAWTKLFSTSSFGIKPMFWHDVANQWDPARIPSWGATIFVCLAICEGCSNKGARGSPSLSLSFIVPANMSSSFLLFSWVLCTSKLH